MHEPYTQLYVHFVWATWDRLPIIAPEWKTAISACIQVECQLLKATVIATEAMPDHVHLLVSLPTAITIAKLIQQVKGASSHLVTYCLSGGEWFKWQGAYGAFTVTKSDIPRVRAYILNQERHHREKTYDRELELTEAENFSAS